MNTQLVESLVQAIRALSIEERSFLEDKLFFESDYPKTIDIAAVSMKGGSFDFLNEEPDLYSLEDGTPIDESSQ